MVLKFEQTNVRNSAFSLRLNCNNASHRARAWFFMRDCDRDRVRNGINVTLIMINRRIKNAEATEISGLRENRIRRFSTGWMLENYLFLSI